MSFLFGRKPAPPVGTVQGLVGPGRGGAWAPPGGQVAPPPGPPLLPQATPSLLAVRVRPTYKCGTI
jgi:hypothetical protein